jgi:hypothetical protein
VTERVGMTEHPGATRHTHPAGLIRRLRRAARGLLALIRDPDFSAIEERPLEQRRHAFSGVGLGGADAGGAIGGFDGGGGHGGGGHG